ncbi:unnamed protein product [Strongylus vulgaris]|uniref:Uncharacterized protein n=1 Tax=Strongylus vulgaris TaxID=40348 RepID=A0A3P7KLT2_STRVU|nr:unnamed protein product [Strongylus vulgaris]
MDEELEEFIEILKIIRNTTLSKDDRLQEIQPRLENYTNTSITLEAMGNLTDLHDYIMEHVENASAKVQEFFYQIYDLTADINFDTKTEKEQDEEVSEPSATARNYKELSEQKK